MVEFRRMIPVLAVLAFLLGSAVTASAQTPLSCVTNGATNTPVRAEGLTELVGDFVISCSGGTPTIPGNPIPPVTIQVFLNTPITSRCMESTTVGCIGFHSEALLMLDEPAPGAQFGCSTNTCTNLGNGLGGVGGYYGGGTITTAGNNKNVFQGIQTASNSITFLGIPIDPPGTGPNRQIRITNIRSDANFLGVASGNNNPTAVTEQITATPFNFLPVSGLATQAVGSVQLGMEFTLRSSATSTGGTPDLKVFQQCFSQSSSSTPSTPFVFIRYRELFSTAFKKRSVLASVANPSATANQNDLAIGTYNTETGFRWNGFGAAGTNNGLPSPTAGSIVLGDADWGTRLKAVFNNIPKDVRLYIDGTSSPTATTSIPPDVAKLTSAESGAYSNTSSGITELTISNGTTSAVWEVLESDALSFAQLNFGVYVRYTANPANSSPGLGTATVNGSYAPTSTQTSAIQTTIPRFADTSTARNLFSIVPCVTNLLFPFVTSQLGFDTGIAISATSTDPFGTSAQSGICTANWYGAAFTGATPFPQGGAPIASGTTQTGLTSSLLSNVAGGFSGYMIAQCRFQYAHGFAFVSDLGARNIAMGYLALVIPDPARAPNPLSVSLAGSGEQLAQ
jgi:hypothetical protein